MSGHWNGKIGLDMQDTHKWPVSITLAHTTQRFVYFVLSSGLLKRIVLLFACFKNAVIKIDSYNNSLGQKRNTFWSLKVAKTFYDSVSKILPVSFFHLSSLPQSEGANWKGENYYYIYIFFYQKWSPKPCIRKKTHFSSPLHLTIYSDPNHTCDGTSILAMWVLGHFVCGQRLKAKVLCSTQFKSIRAFQQNGLGSRYIGMVNSRISFQNTLRNSHVIFQLLLRCISINLRWSLTLMPSSAINCSLRWRRLQLIMSSGQQSACVKFFKVGSQQNKVTKTRWCLRVRQLLRQMGHVSSYDLHFWFATQIGTILL